MAPLVSKHSQIAFVILIAAYKGLDRLGLVISSQSFGNRFTTYCRADAGSQFTRKLLI